MKKILLILLVCISPSLVAGSQNGTNAKFSADKIASFAKQVEQYAAGQGARAFIIGRVGKNPDELPRGINYTHTAIAVYSQIALKDGSTSKGYVIHNLYQRSNNPERSDLVSDYPLNFFWGAQQLKAGIAIPTPAVQQRLIEAISNGVNKKVHNPKYSVIANPMNNQYQNCTEHTLLVLNAAIYQTSDLARLYANNKAYFSPQPVHTSKMKLLLGSAFVSGVTTKDHDSAVKTATFTSISQYLARYNLLHKSVTITDNGSIIDNS